MSTTPPPQLDEHRRCSGEPCSGSDLSRYRAVRWLLLWRGFPWLFQGLCLAGLLLLTALAWGRQPPAGVSLKLWAQGELTNLLLWGLWWPVLMWVVVLAGRSWCAVCPLELVSALTGRLGRHLGLRQRELGPWARAGWWALLAFMLVQLLHAAHHLLRVPAITAWLLLVLVGAAALAGLLLRHRAFCRAFCPSTLLLSAFGRGSMLVLRPSGVGPRQPVAGLACDSLLDPERLDHSADCLLCGQCVKALGTDRMRLQLRRPFHPADRRHPFASWPLTLFVISSSGFAAKRLLCQTSGGWEQAFLAPPAALAAQLGQGWLPVLDALWVCVFFPLLLWALLGGVALALRGGAGLGEAWRRLALPAAVIVASADMAKTLYKVASRVRFVPQILDDPWGDQTPAAIAQGQLPMPPFPVPLPLIAGLSILIIALGLAYGLREARLADGDASSGRQLALGLLGGGYLALMGNMLLSG
jgi:hypothetical protein